MGLTIDRERFDPVDYQRTGAAWQRQALTALEPRLGRRRALTAVLERYLDHQRTGHPVHTWPLPGPGGG